MMVSKDKRVQALLTPQYAKALDDLVKGGVYINEAEAVRAGISLLFKYHKLIYIHITIVYLINLVLNYHNYYPFMVIKTKSLIEVNIINLLMIILNH